MSSWSVVKWVTALLTVTFLMWCVGSQYYLEIFNDIKGTVQENAPNPSIDW